METGVPSYRAHLGPRGWRAGVVFVITTGNEGLGALPLMH